MRFEKVSYGTFLAGCIESGHQIDPWELKRVYEEMELPKQGSAHSAGMDLFAPFTFTLGPDEEMVIPTGMRWRTDITERDRVMLIVPRSGLAFKTGMHLVNTIGVIDADYCDAENEGHILVKIHNPHKEKTLFITEGKAFVQAIIVPYMICAGAFSEEARTGGFGSTDRR